MKKLFFILSFSLFLSPFSFLLAEDTGVGIEVSASKKIVKGLEASVEAEVRTQDAVSQMERWSIGAGIDYKILKWLKADVGYLLLMRNIPESTSKKYDLKQYWSPRHRAYASIVGTWKLPKHFALSLRERYQYTYETQQYVERYHLGTNKRADDKVVGDEADHLLRSRLELGWSRKKCNWSPFISVEALNSLQDGFSLDQMRYTLGTDYKLNKKSKLGLSYRYKDKNDKEESKGHLISIKYSYEF